MKTKHAIAGLRTGDLMSSPLIKLTTSDTMPKAAKLLLENHISGAPVYDAAGRAVGVLTKTDFLRYERTYVSPIQAEWRRLALHNEPLEAVAKWSSPAREREEDYVLHWMKRGVVSVSPDAPITDAARIMADRRIHRVFVRERGNLIGVLTAYDLLRAFASPGR